jgi:E3 ubiquitin-protein ligase MARCH5
METNTDNVSDKSPSLDRSLIEELHNLDGVALSNLEDWNKKVGGSAVSVDTLCSTTADKDDQNDEHSKEWSPSSSDLVPADPPDGATALCYSSFVPPQDMSDDITDSDIETAGSHSDHDDDFTDYENSDMVEYQAAVEAGRVDDERQCWVCFASQEDDPVAAWVHPCLCKGTTKWVHQVCIQRWVDEKQKGNNNTGVSCPQCGADYCIQFPPSPAALRLLDTLDKLVGRLCPVVAGGVCVGSLYWTCVTYGAVTVMQVTGHDKGLILMETADPLFLLVSLPLVPVGLVLAKMIRWQEPVLNFMRARLPKLAITKYILPAFSTEPVAEGSASAANLPPPSDPVSVTRTFCGALFFPTVATFLGSALFEDVKSPLKRAAMGGFCFVGVKGVLKIYHKQHQYIRQCRRLILDYQQ